MTIKHSPCKLRSLPKELKEKILSNKKEQSADSDNYTKEYEYLSNRVIVNYSEKRRSKDKHARENLLTKLRSQLGEKGETSKLIKNTGMKRYIVSEKSETKIDESKVCTAIPGESSCYVGVFVGMTKLY